MSLLAQPPLLSPQTNFLLIGQSKGDESKEDLFFRCGVVLYKDDYELNAWSATRLGGGSFSCLFICWDSRATKKIASAGAEKAKISAE